MILSQPHFLGADEDVINSVEGLSPDPEKHSSFYDLNPVRFVQLFIALTIVALTCLETYIIFTPPDVWLHL